MHASAFAHACARVCVCISCVRVIWRDMKTQPRASLRMATSRPWATKIDFICVCVCVKQTRTHARTHAHTMRPRWSGQIGGIGPNWSHRQTTRRTSSNPGMLVNVYTRDTPSPPCYPQNCAAHTFTLTDTHNNTHSHTLTCAQPTCTAPTAGAGGIGRSRRRASISSAPWKFNK